jgi:hypothetical protein
LGSTWRRHLTRSRGVTAVWVGPASGVGVIGAVIGYIGAFAYHKLG